MYLPANSLEGRRLGTYRIGRPLGRGGMGEVYLAHDEALDRQVAIKTLIDRYAQDQNFIRRFQREARAAAKLSHPNIVQIYAVDIHAKPPYLAMEFIDGVPLDTLIGPDKKMPWQRALTICGQVASALQAAHAAGIIHRDIKPQNILIDRAGRARVSDFGIAKILDSASSLTSADMTVGSPFYMSPEQCGVGDVVPSSDLFSLGITTFEMIAGGLPFQGETALALMRKITMEPLPPLIDYADDVPFVVQDFVDLLTAKSPAERYPSATAVLEDLNALRNGQVPPRLASRPTSARTPAHALPTLAVGNNLQFRNGGNAAPDSRRALVANLLDEDPEDPFRKPPPRAHKEVELPWTLIVGIVAVLGAALLLWPLYNRLQQQPFPPTASPASSQQPPPPPPPPFQDGTDPSQFKGPPPPRPGGPGSPGFGPPGGPGGQRRGGGPGPNAGQRPGFPPPGGPPPAQ